MDNLDFNFFCSDCRQTAEYRKANCFTRYRLRRYERGDYLAFTGDRVRELSLLVEGTITVSFVLSSGSVIRSVVHRAPYPIGALAIIGRENRYRVDIEANETCEVISVERSEIENRIMNCREFMLSFFDYSTSKLDLLVGQMAVLSQRSITAKVAYYIFTCSEDGHTFDLRRTVQQLADYLCVERPSLSRVLSSLSKQGLINYKGGRGEILDVHKLKRFVE